MRIVAAVLTAEGIDNQWVMNLRRLKSPLHYPPQYKQSNHLLTNA
jgi:hypothetical protein